MDDAVQELADRVKRIQDPTHDDIGQNDDPYDGKEQTYNVNNEVHSASANYPIIPCNALRVTFSYLGERGPNIARPMRSWVAPSSTAIS